MKKALLPLLAVFILGSCSVKNAAVRCETPSGTVKSGETLKNGDVIRSAEALDERVAYMSENYLPSAPVTLRDLDVWNELLDYYSAEHDILVTRGITKLDMTYTEQGGYVSAELIPEYDDYMKITAAYKNKDTSGLTAEEKKVYGEAVKIIEKIPKNDSVFDKELQIHDYLVGRIEYDDAAAKGSFGVYGALIGGKAVCSGYAKSFKMLMNMLGVDCLIVTGTAGDQAHAWNLINIKDEWYQVDVTWDDPDEYSITHKYFNVTDKIMSQEHVWNKKNYRAAESTKYNYYKYKGMEASSAKELSKMFSSAYGKGEREFETVCTYDFSSEDLTFLSQYGQGYFSDSPYGDDIFLSLVING